MTYSDKNGNFWFTGLEPGKRYRVYEAMPAGGYTEGEAKNIDLDNDGTLDVHGYTMPGVLLAAQEYVAKAGDTIHVMDGVEENDPFPEPTLVHPDPGNDGLPPIAAENGSPWDVDADGVLTQNEIDWATESQALKDWYWTGRTVTTKSSWAGRCNSVITSRVSILKSPSTTTTKRMALAVRIRCSTVLPSPFRRMASRRR